MCDEKLVSLLYSERDNNRVHSYRVGGCRGLWHVDAGAMMPGFHRRRLTLSKADGFLWVLQGFITDQKALYLDSL